MKKTTLSDLRGTMFQAMEMLMNNNDPVASANEKIDVATAKALADMAQVVVNAAKVEVEALSMLSKAENPELAKRMLNGMDVMDVKE